MKKLAFALAGIAVAVAALVAIERQDAEQDERFCAMIEQQEAFDGHTVDMLWNWKTKGNPSPRFLELYEQKVKDLPGWRP